MADKFPEKRKAKRYSTEVKIHFDFAYDLETKVDFELIDKNKKESLSEKYHAVGQNISVEGLCFVTYVKVNENDLLHLEVYLPSAKNPIDMKGEVIWCKPISSSQHHGLEGGENQKTYQVGVKLLFVDGLSVQETVHYDEEYEVKWSVVLESVFGSYKMLMGEKYKKKSE